MNYKESRFKLYFNDKFIENMNYKKLRNYCKENGLILDNILRTLPDYKNEKRRNRQYKGYKIIKVSNNIDEIVKETKIENKPLINDNKEIDFIKGRIRAEKIIHLNVDNINEKDILNEFNLDIKEWQIEKLNYSLWDSPNKEKGSISLYSVRCQFKKRNNFDYDIETLKNIIDENIGKKVGKQINLEKDVSTIEKYLLINIADLHLNKYSNDYNLLIAHDRYNSALNYFVNNTNARTCILVIGEDFFNIDTLSRTTTKGTIQDTEVDVYKMFEFGLKMLINSLTYLSLNFDKVNVILIQGNHDKLLSYMLVKALEQREYAKDNVYFDSSISTRKYITIGDSLIGLGHLDTENKKQKPFLMQNEVKEKYGKSKYNYFISGHFHNYSVDEVGGIQYIRLPSLSGIDNWHDEMGYTTQIKGAMAFEFIKYGGMVKKIIYNV